MKAYEHTLRYYRRHVRSRIGAIAFIVILSCSPAHAEPRVILLRGWFGVFSTGLDEIAEALKAKGIRAEVDSHLYWKAAVAEIVRERAEGRPTRLCWWATRRAPTTSSTWPGYLRSTTCRLRC